MDDDETRVYNPVPQAPESARDLVGTVLAGRYKILSRLGEGAMGSVYLGQHLNIGRKDAIKVLHSAMARDPDAIARFDRGARNVGAIRHPNVCTIYDFSNTDDGLQYLAMEFVSGEALNDILAREGALPLPRAVRIAEQIASALEAAHKVGVVHRDLKPANVMVSAGPDGVDSVKVVDFDISKGSDGAPSVDVTRMGFIVGTPQYMSPEQFFGDKLDGRSDVYSLALLVYRMIAGALPFRAESVQELMATRIADTALLRLADIAPDTQFPPALQDVLNRALQLRPDDRTASAAQFATELRAATDPPGDAQALAATRSQPSSASLPRTTTDTPAATRLAPRRIVIAVGTIALVALGVFQGLRGFGTRPPATVAETPGGDAAAPVKALPPVVRDEQPKSPASSNSTPTPASNRPTARTGSELAPPAATGAADPSPALKGVGTTAMLDLGNVKPILDAQRDRMMDPSLPLPTALRAMRDTAMSIFALQGLDTPSRARAAYMVASISESLKDSENCATWLARARTLAPSFRGYAMLVCE